MLVLLSVPRGRVSAARAVAARLREQERAAAGRVVIRLPRAPIAGMTSNPDPREMPAAGDPHPPISPPLANERRPR
jgi:hypothetical protein